MSNVQSLIWSLPPSNDRIWCWLSYCRYRTISEQNTSLLAFSSSLPSVPWELKKLHNIKEKGTLRSWQNLVFMEESLLEAQPTVLRIDCNRKEGTWHFRQQPTSSHHVHVPSLARSQINMHQEGYFYGSLTCTASSPYKMWCTRAVLCCGTGAVCIVV